MAVPVALCLASCISGHRTIAADVSPEGWNEPVVLRYANTDTLTPKELSLSFRYAGEASPRDGSFVVGTSAPSGTQMCDTLQVELASGFDSASVTPTAAQDNNLHETVVPVGSQVVLTETGDYVFTVTPLQKMRGIWSIALDFK